MAQGSRLKQGIMSSTACFAPADADESRQLAWVNAMLRTEFFIQYFIVRPRTKIGRTATRHFVPGLPHGKRGTLARTVPPSLRIPRALISPFSSGLALQVSPFSPYHYSDSAERDGPLTQY